MSPLLWGALFGVLAGVAIALAALIGVWAERKVSAKIQMRIGPNEAGPAGLLQTLADTIKLVLKEDITPRQAEVGAFRIAPFLVFTPIAVSLIVIPIAYGWAPLQSGVGVLFFLAVPSIAVMGVLLAGWSSRNTYATLGGVRGAAQMISYELPRTLSIVAICIMAGSLAPGTILTEWRWWWIPVNLIGFVVYFISSLAELNRGPFDIPEAESELVAGYFADYSGIRWAIFMMAEYGGVLAASLFGAVMFFGGGLGLHGLIGIVIMLLIAASIAVLMIWAKWTFPRMRADQLMSVAWKVLTPLALLQLLIVGVIAPWH